MPAAAPTKWSSPYSPCSTSVFDDGPGVPADRIGDLVRRFDRFDRAQTGTGLGLYISRALAQAHGGDIRYRRTHGGSEFALELPTTAALA